MAYPTIAAQGAVTSWGTTNFYSQFLANMKSAEATVTETGDSLDSTGISDASMTNRPGLVTIDVAIRGYAFATPRVGNVGLVAFNSGGYALYVDRYDVEITAPALQYTGFSDTATVHKFRPGNPSWRGSFQGKIDNATAIIGANAIGDTLKTLTMTYGTDSSNNTLAGSIILTPMEAALRQSDLNTVTYGFTGTGDLTANGTSSLFGTGSNPTTNYVLTPLWNLGSTAVGAMVVTASTGRTYTITDSFWKSIRVRCAVGSLVSVEVDVQGLTANTKG